MYSFKYISYSKNGIAYTFKDLPVDNEISLIVYLSSGFTIATASLSPCIVIMITCFFSIKSSGTIFSMSGFITMLDLETTSQLNFFFKYDTMRS